MKKLSCILIALATAVSVLAIPAAVAAPFTDIPV